MKKTSIWDELMTSAAPVLSGMVALAICIGAVYAAGFVLRVLQLFFLGG